MDVFQSSSSGSVLLHNPLFSLVTLVNNPDIYQLSQQTLVEQHTEGEIEWAPVNANANGWNAATGLNHGIDATSAPWIVCAHQDILFPDGWWARVQDQIAKWKRETLGVIGLVGSQPNGRLKGHVMDPHGHSWWQPLPTRVLTIDEHIIILRRDSGLRFDNKNPGFHCYGTDISLEARRRQADVIAIDAPVVHLSGGQINKSFTDAAQWLLGKWGASFRGVIPVSASIVYEKRVRTIPKRGWVYLNRRLQTIPSGDSLTLAFNLYRSPSDSLCA